MKNSAELIAKAHWFESQIANEDDDLVPPENDNYVDPEKIDEIVALARSLLDIAEQPEPQVGQLWLAVPNKGEGELTCLIITAVAENGEFIRGVVARPELWMGGEQDIVIPAGESPTGEAFLACQWLDMPVSKKSLNRCYGSIGDNALKSLLMVLQNSITGGYECREEKKVKRDEIEGAHDALSTLSVLSIKHATEGHKASFISGPKLQVDDVRHRIRAHFRISTSFIANEAIDDLD